MASRRTLQTAALLALSLSAAFAGPAAAKDFCVDDPGCEAAGGEHRETIQSAFTGALFNDGEDTVHIGPGIYKGEFSYAAGAGNVVHVVGAGRGKTTLTLPEGILQRTVLRLETLGDSVRDLDIVVPGGVGNVGLRLREAHAENLGISSTDSDEERAVELRDGSLRQADIAVPHGSAVVAEGASQLADVVANADYGVMGADGAGFVRVRRARIHAAYGIVLRGGGIVEDTLVVSESPKGYGVMASAFPDESSGVDVSSSTIVGLGAGFGAGAYAAQNAIASIRITDSIITGFETDLYRMAQAGSADVHVAWSSFDPTRTLNQDIDGGSGVITTEQRVEGGPAFVGPAAGNYRLGADSPLLDAGRPGGLEPGESATDLDGQPRIAARYEGGEPRRDLGAFERASGPVLPPPSEPAPEPPAAEPAPGPLALALSGKARQRGKAVVVTARAGEAASLKASASVRGARRVRLRPAVADAAAGTPVKLALRIPRASRARIARALSAGRRVRVTVTVTARAGERTATAARRVRLVG